METNEKGEEIAIVTTMTPEKIIKLRVEAKSKLDTKYARILKLEEEGVTEYYQYASIDERFITSDYWESEDLFRQDATNVRRILETYDEEKEKHKNEIGLHDDVNYYCYDEDCDDEHYLKLKWYKLRTGGVEDYMIKADVKSYLEKVLHNNAKKIGGEENAGNRAKSIDCKLLELFKGGNITWEILTTLVYTDCNL